MPNEKYLPGQRLLRFRAFYWRELIFDFIGFNWSGTYLEHIA